MLETSRRKSLAWLNSRYIYGRIPLLHTIIFLVEIAMAARLLAKFNSYYRQKPILTTMITNAILGGIADTVAQSITAIRARQAMLRTSIDSRSFISSGVELEDLNEKPARLSPTLSPRYPGPQPFDFERLTRFMAYGFLMAPIQFVWFAHLTKWFPITSKSGTVPALKRVAMDQLIFAPIGLSAFFTFMTVAEGGGRPDIIKKFQDVYVPTLRANYILWPAVQILNFRVMPLQFQIPFVSAVGIAWTAYLSLANSSEEEAFQ
ncbi:uncharacterized protein Z518_11108 [Rhinocladiella mackenziei CBS 650.93]|uniref:Rhinocladiella mackenziei CBS 650.93 unplaced genomic scaffold supercont1.11, whole genome shotgun sequence n=1 Tax=Rhinocladiella mackenziei CBS 650.93 TaxID=1442369 RepID=A0A0D2I8X3_9EURO|nr:uncharacterized protein Z518_11108 [Rhinocladiella mackenziei CBS 650.93]KIW99695.1 hypothetical protein Z518_11108 [Rhinocladiella mackenziei CBS 650.93]